MNKHVTTVHTRCPYAPVWDYYTVTFVTPAFLRCEDFQAICDKVRGVELQQEKVANLIAKQLRVRGTLSVSGCHGQNGRLVVTKKVRDK